MLGGGLPVGGGPQSRSVKGLLWSQGLRRRRVCMPQCHLCRGILPEITSGGDRGVALSLACSAETRELVLDVC